MIKITVNREACIGASACVARAGKTFKLDKEERVIVFNPTGNEEEDILLAAKECPPGAITVSNSNIPENFKL